MPINTEQEKFQTITKKTCILPQKIGLIKMLIEATEKTKQPDTNTQFFRAIKDIMELGEN